MEAVGIEARAPYALEGDDPRKSRKGRKRVISVCGDAAAGGVLQTAVCRVT